MEPIKLTQYSHGAGCGCKISPKILDEILKGTNSEDKLIGSQKFLEKLIKSPTKLIGFIATHDLELTKMESENPDHIINYCF